MYATLNRPDSGASGSDNAHNLASTRTLRYFTPSQDRRLAVASERLPRWAVVIYMSKHAARNAEICRLYVSGIATPELGRQFKLTRQRIKQILKLAGLHRTDRAYVASNRDAFLGVDVTPTVKDALRAEAARRGVSMSELSSETLKEMLVECGHPLEAEKINAE